MSLYNYHSYIGAGISVPSESPFFPHINGNLVSFNQGFVFDYQQKESGCMKTIPVEMGESYNLDDGSIFYVQITTPINSAQVYNASVTQAALPSDESSSFHYSAENLDGTGLYEYKDKDGLFVFPMCDFEKDPDTYRWFVKNITLRENIHWQKINFKNTLPEIEMATGIGILRNWGDMSTGVPPSPSFLNNPNVEFKRIVQKPTGEEFLIKIEDSPNGENIVITNQLPSPPDPYNMILSRVSGSWQWMILSPNSYVITDANAEIQCVAMETKSMPYVDASGIFSQLPFPDCSVTDTGGPQVLHSNCGTIYWDFIDVYY